MADNTDAPTVDEDQIAEGGDATAVEKLDLKIDIEDAGPCRKHVKITVLRADVDRVMDDQVQEFVDSAAVPGFRPGHVPDALVRKRYRKELAEKVKQELLMASLAQLGEADNIEPINEPNIDVEGIELPDEGDFTYQFDVEVRPTFDLPEYKGLEIERPTREITDADIDAYTDGFLEQYSHLVPVDEPAKAGDLVVADVEVTHGDRVVQKLGELSVRIRPTLRFYDAEFEGFDKLMVGAAADDVREATVTVSQEADELELRGEQVSVKFTVLDVKRPELPALDEAFFERIGASSEADLKSQFRSMLERQVQYAQRRAVREQVLEKITASADWDLPEELLRKQVENAMRREKLEMQQAGFSTSEIRAREGELRQNSLTTTRQNLKQHFILDRVAEEENVDVTGADVETEIMMMAMQSGENPRRVRSRLIKSGMIENLEAQIRERKAVDVILANAKFKDIELPPFMEQNVEAIDRSLTSGIADTAVEYDDADDEEAEEA
ncbi:MAG: trigger factor [Planctomycetaceae bacterium]